jgi:hypothetical protein
VTETDKEKLVCQYTAGQVTWRTLRGRGIESYLDVLAALGQLGLRPPIAPMDGPNNAIRQGGIALLRQALKDAKQ